MLFFALNVLHAQFDIPEKPNFINPVIDSTKTLNQREYKLLYDKLKKQICKSRASMTIVI